MAARGVCQLLLSLRPLGWPSHWPSYCYPQNLGSSPHAAGLCYARMEDVVDPPAGADLLWEQLRESDRLISAADLFGPDDNGEEEEESASAVRDALMRSALRRGPTPSRQ